MIRRKKAIEQTVPALAQLERLADEAIQIAQQIRDEVSLLRTDDTVQAHAKDA